MMTMMIHWIVSALLLMFLAQVLPGLFVASFLTALIATFVLSLVNMLIKPVLSFLTLPITFLTLGLFSFVLNALMFWLASALVPGFDVSNFFTALIGSIAFALLTGLIFNILPSNPARA
ncbi:MAG: phage holin family protein [Candidatus Melainabacteria bacterium]